MRREEQISWEGERKVMGAGEERRTELTLTKKNERREGGRDESKRV